jgi:hypothetical protein
LFLDERGKNSQACMIWKFHRETKRKISNLQAEDYSEGPLEEKMRGILPMWSSGKN